MHSKRRMMALFLRSKSKLVTIITLILLVEIIVNYIFENGKKNSTVKVNSNPHVNIPNNLIFLDNDANVNTSAYVLEYKELLEKTEELRDYYDLNLNKDVKVIESDKRDEKHLNKTFYKILEYTKVFRNTRFCQDYDGDVSSNDPNEFSWLYLNECPYKNCHFTCDKSQASKVDAVLFHEWDFDDISIEEKIFLKKYLSKTSNRINQVWILWNDEPNVVSKALNKYYFNWTMTYRHDSELFDCAYGCAYEKVTFDYDQENSINNRRIFIDNMKVEFKKRSNKALWFVSNCKASKRLKLAAQLNRHYPIKIQGKCNLNDVDIESSSLANEKSYLQVYIFDTLKFLFKFTMQVFESKKDMPPPCRRNSRCEYDEFKSHKFYLSFESQNCTNYITEKLWRILRTKQIPVVFQPHKRFYQMFAPPDSFIHAGDFDYDATKLGAYLDNVSNNFDLYLKHHMWRLGYDIVYSGKQCEARRMCQLCTKLNTERSNIYYTKLSNWFNNHCIRN